MPRVSIRYGCKEQLISIPLRFGAARQLHSYRGAAIADTARGMEGPTMRLELLRASDEQSAWQVALEGDVVVAFAGPDAEQRAQRCYTELKARLNPPDEAEPPEEPS